MPASLSMRMDGESHEHSMKRNQDRKNPCPRASGLNYTSLVGCDGVLWYSRKWKNGSLTM